VLVGDIGGTNARLSLWGTNSSHQPVELMAKTFPTQDHWVGTGFTEVLKKYMAAAAAQGLAPKAAALAFAGVVEDNRCDMTNTPWEVDGSALEKEFGIKFALMNDFEAVGYGVPALDPVTDMVTLNRGVTKDMAPKVVMGPGTGLGAAQLMWDEGRQDYKVWPGEGSHATFAPRGWKQQALAAYAAQQLGGHVEIEQVACGPGLELIYSFLLSDEPANRRGIAMGAAHAKKSSAITSGALNESDPLAEEAVDMFMAIVGAEAGAMALRCLAKGGVYIAGGITPRLLPRLRKCPSGGGALLDGFMARNLRPRFREVLATIPLYVITNDKVGQIGAREYAKKLAHIK